MFVTLWDSLLQQPDKFDVFRKFPFDHITLGTNANEETLDWEIKRRRFTSSQRLERSKAMKLLDRFEEDGYRVVETEWHHSAFTPPSDTTPARSTVSILLHIAKPIAVTTDYRAR